MMNPVDMAIEACVTALGRDAWMKLSAGQQHDMIMTIIKDFLKALERIDSND